MHLPISDKIELNILHQNSHQAEKNKVKFNNYNLLCLNIMSSPGAGKTRLLEITLEDLSTEFQSAVLEGDMTTNLDAARLKKLNIPVVPITTGRACHLDANMVSGGLKLLEPVMRVEVVTPEDYMGDVIGDLNSRRGQISTQEQRGNATVITAMVPLANMFGYINSLRSMSQGRAQYSMFFDHYAKVPQNVQDEVTKKIAG